MVFDITDDNFQTEVMESELPVLIDFYADWCAPCRQMGPIFEEVSERYEGRVKFGRIDTKTEKGLRIKFAIAGIPQLTLVKQGKRIDVVDELMPASEIERRLDIALSGELDDRLARPIP